LAAPPGAPPPPGLFAQAHHVAGANQAGSHGGGPECEGAPADPAGPVAGGRGVGHLPADAGIQGLVVRGTAGSGAAE
ncbi:hypothetical protein ABTO49_22110, partial [Acinetobacter baumannii]